MNYFENEQLDCDDKLDMVVPILMILFFIFGILFFKSSNKISVIQQNIIINNIKNQIQSQYDEKSLNMHIQEFFLEES